ncbi:MAG: hypothetical protein AAGI25_03855 [Bacteroidota bacterium]
MRRLFAVIIFLFVGSVARGQVLYYNVVKGNKKLGNMMVKRTVLENGTYYEIDSKVTFGILFSFTSKIQIY